MSATISQSIIVEVRPQFLRSSRAQMRSGRAHVALSLRSRRAQTPPKSG